MVKELAKKLVAVVKAVDAVEKRGHNTAQNYDYVKAADVAREIRKVLAEQGIAFSYDCTETERWEKVTNSGGTLFFVQLKIAVTFTDNQTGDAVTVGGIGWGMDSGDKAIYKAMTGALKYALRMNFLIPDEWDPENDSAEVKQVRRTVEEQPAEIPAPKKITNGSGNHVAGPKDAHGDAAISEGKAKRFMAIALSTNKSRDEIGKALAKEGLSDIKHCPWKRDKKDEGAYDRLCAWAGQQ